MDGLFARGGAVALLTIGGAVPAAAQGGSPVRVPRDSVVRVIDAAVHAQMDSIHALMRAFGSEPVTSEQSLRLRQELEAMTTAIRAAAPRGTARIIVQGGDGPFPFEMQTRGWIGITTGDVPQRQEVGPGGHFIQYFAHPAIVSVERNSPAQAAGIVAGDSLIAYDGVDVVGRVLNLSQMLQPDRKLGITVRRAGENREYSITVVKAPLRMFLRRVDPDDPAFSRDQLDERVFRGPGEGGGRIGRRQAGGESWIGSAFGRGGGFTLSSNGLFGASMMTLEPVLAKSLNLQPGVLIKEVSEATAADRAGLRPGDVIVAVGGQAVSTVSEVQVASMNRADNRTVTFQVIREKKPRVITVTWPPPPPTTPSP